MVKPVKPTSGSFVERGWSLWRQLAEGRPTGHPEYRRPGPSAAHTGLLHDVDLGDLLAPDHLGARRRLALFASAVAGIVRFELSDLVGPHHSAPSIRGVRVTELEALLHGQWAVYDPTRHAFAEPDADLTDAASQGAAPSETDSGLPDALRLVVDLSRVPDGYTPVREVVGLMEAGMHLATFGWLAGLLYPAAAFELGDVPVEAVRRWTLATVDLRREGKPAAHPLGRLAAVSRPDRAIRSRSAGRGPWGLVPARRTEGQREAVRARVRSLLAYDHRVGLSPVVLPAEELAAVFTYPDDRVDVAAADAAVFWRARRSDNDSDARNALLSAGAASQRLGLALGEEGFFVRPVRSFDPVVLARGSDVVVMASVVGRSSYDELSIALA